MEIIKWVWEKIVWAINTCRFWLNKYAPILFLIFLFAGNVYIFNLNKVYGIIDGYLKLILTSWPAVILFLGLWRKDVIDYLAKHLESFELLGAKAKINQSASEQQIKEENIESAAREVQKQEQISASTTSSGENKEELKAKIATLEQALLKETKNKLFERIYRLIYGSQIRLLFDLNAKGSVATSVAAQHYMDAVVKFQAIRNYPYRDYINFLEKAGLVTVTDPFESGFITISEQGREFLRFLLEEKLDTTHKEN